jgi:UDP-N-acetylmuramate--alanine ligase
MTNFLNFSNFYFVGIKGVAMTSLASCLSNYGKKVFGCDVEADFVTKEALEKLNIEIEVGFNHTLNSDIDCIIYTGAHQGSQNPLVLQAKNIGIPCYSQAQALSFLFNQKQGIAVCGVGGKSTISAMLAFILKKLEVDLSYSVGVGAVVGLDSTGVFTDSSKFFVAEADEYINDPSEFKKTKKIIPRFSFLNPKIIICPNLKYDHPDIYNDFNDTKRVFLDFFKKLPQNGFLIYNCDDKDLVQLIEQFKNEVKFLPNLITFGKNKGDCFFQENEIIKQKNVAKIFYKNKEYKLKISVPGEYNIYNTLAVLSTVDSLGLGFSFENLVKEIGDFKSTKRRFQFLGEINHCLYYDDYAHHPNEIKNVIKAVKKWHPQKKIIVAFQSHTYSRTKQLFPDFVDSFSEADRVIMTDIFPSMREKIDKTISSDLLCQKIKEKYPSLKAQNLKSNEKLADFCYNNLGENDLLLCLGAGNIYHFYEMLKNRKEI